MSSMAYQPGLIRLRDVKFYLGRQGAVLQVKLNINMKCKDLVDLTTSLATDRKSSQP